MSSDAFRKGSADGQLVGQKEKQRRELQQANF